MRVAKVLGGRVGAAAVGRRALGGRHGQDQDHEAAGCPFELETAGVVKGIAFVLR